MAIYKYWEKHFFVPLLDVLYFLERFRFLAKVNRKSIPRYLLLMYDILHGKCCDHLHVLGSSRPFKDFTQLGPSCDRF